MTTRTTARKYAAGTDVAATQSLDEIKSSVRRYGGDLFSHGWSDERTEVVAFRICGRLVRFTIPHPDPSDRLFEAVYNRRSTAHATRPKDVDAAVRMETDRRWRLVALAVTSRLALVSEGAETAEQAFTPYLVLPDGSTLGEKLAPQLARMYEVGAMPPLLALGATAGVAVDG